VAERDFVFFTLCFRPTEASLLQSFGAHPQAAAVPEQQFQPIALRVGEQKDVSAQRVARRIRAGVLDLPRRNGVRCHRKRIGRRVGRGASGGRYRVFGLPHNAGRL
jgi:hypothetical protein